MSVDAFVDSTQLDSDLTSIANAIRSKNGTSNQLAFPSGFTTGINNIVTISPIKMHSDAELVKTWSKDSWLNADEEIEIPAYSTTATTLVASEALETYTLDYSNYAYFLTARGLVYPEYSVTTRGKGRVEYGLFSSITQIPYIPANTLEDFSGDASVSAIQAGNMPLTFYRQISWSSASALQTNTGTTYGLFQVYQDNGLSSGVLTINAPTVRIRGNSTYLASTYYNAITDIRRQYKFELYRMPRSGAATDGWAQEHSLLHIIDCIKSSTHTLT